MSTLKTTIVFESAALFPVPMSFTKIATETLTGTYASFQTNTLAAGSLETLFETSESIGNSGVLYFYANAASTNTKPIDLVIDNKSTSQSYFVRLIPGDIAYLPVFAADYAGIKISARNNDPSAEAGLTYFYGSKD
jgi:hypothetical protein